MMVCSGAVTRVKIYAPAPARLKGDLGVLHPPVPSPFEASATVQVPDTGMLAVFAFLKDAKVRFKVLDPDGSCREGAPSRRDWIQAIGPTKALYRLGHRRRSGLHDGPERTPFSRTTITGD